MIQNVPSVSQVHNAALVLAATAKACGVPQDSLERFLKAGYVPQPRQLEFHAAARECDKPDGPTQVGFGGARGPGKSHAVFAQAALDDCHRVPGLKVLYLRKIQKNAKEQFEDLRRAVLRGVAHTFTNSVLHFPNSSRLFLGHFKNESDIDQYLGIEYDLIVIEEATTLSLIKYRALRDSNRTSKAGFRPRIYCTTNPGGVGHGWFKATFIVPARQLKEVDTRFVFGTVEDNVFNDADYKKKLEENTGWRLRAYRYGDWDIAAGQFFSTWNYEAIVRENLKIMPGAPVWCSLDYGFQHPTVCYLFSEYDGKKQVIDEHWRRHALASEHATDIKAMLARHGLTISSLKSFVASPDAFAQRGNESGKTIADQYRDHGIQLTRANDDRVNGAAYLLKLLGRRGSETEEAIEPQIEISTRCVRLIENIPTLQHDPHRPEDVLKVNIDDDGNGGDDPYDAVRYGLMAREIHAPQQFPGTTGSSIFE
jgi:phage terminase large subunit